jgi:hypothetical protein
MQQTLNRLIEQDHDRRARVANMPPPGHVPPHDGQSGYGQYGHQPDDYYGQQPGYAQQPWYGQDPGYGRQGYPQAGYGSGYPPSGDRPTRT